MKLFFLYLQYIVLRVFLVGVFVLIFIGPFYLHTPVIDFLSHTYYNSLYEYVKTLPMLLFIIEYLICVFIIGFVLIFIYMAYYYYNKLYHDKLYNRYFNLFVEFQFKYMYADNNLSNETQLTEIKIIKSLLNSDYKKRIFLKLLNRVNVQIIGIAQDRNLQLLNELQYNYLINAYLHSPLTKHKLFALSIISTFKLKGFDDYIFKLATKQNSTIKSEALVTILKLDIYDNLRFLNNYNIKLTIWDIDILIKVLQEKNLDNIEYAELINSKNNEISALGIMLARLNKHVEFKNIIKEKIHHTSQLVSDEAFLTFISFVNDKSDYDFLMDTFEIASENAQLYIVKAIVNHENNVEKLKFLNWVVDNKSLGIKVEAIRELIEIDLHSIERFKKSNNPLVRNACLQVLDLNLE